MAKWDWRGLSEQEWLRLIERESDRREARRDRLLAGVVLAGVVLSSIGMACVVAWLCWAVWRVTGW
jgi:hypothetical protein